MFFFEEVMILKIHCKNNWFCFIIYYIYLFIYFKYFFSVCNTVAHSVGIWLNSTVRKDPDTAKAPSRFWELRRFRDSSVTD